MYIVKIFVNHSKSAIYANLIYIYTNDFISTKISLVKFQHRGSDQIKSEYLRLGLSSRNLHELPRDESL